MSFKQGNIADKPINFSPLFLFFIILSSFAFTGTAAPFPPDDYQYTGDYVLITEPGRYSLENNITHTYPIGVIIASSSVILDGQGKWIKPATTGVPTVGIWITQTDASGELITGVIVRNVKLSDEVVGIYNEGYDSSEFPWGSDRTGTYLSDLQKIRELKLSDISIKDCTIGLVSRDIHRITIEKAEIERNKEGVILSNSTPDIKGSMIRNNSRGGITLTRTNGGTVSGSIIQNNAGGGLKLEEVTGLSIWNNILDNHDNLVLNGGNDALLYREPKAAPNIINGRITAGNYWAVGGIGVLEEQGIRDLDSDGVGDSPYIAGPGLSDLYPLVPAGFGGLDTKEPKSVSEAIVPVTPVPTPFSIITGFHAVISADTIPSEMKAGDTVKVSLTLTNAGTDDWLSQQSVGIRALDIAGEWGTEWMQVPSLVQSKQSHTFSFDLHTPQEPGLYELRYQAARGGQGTYATFGRPYIKKITLL